ncbi:MAG: hypothetical protein AAGK47_04990, partial [Bacteroidota bacterium]
IVEKQLLYLFVVDLTVCFRKNRATAFLQSKCIPLPIGRIGFHTIFDIGKYPNTLSSKRIVNP